MSLMDGFAAFADQVSTQLIRREKENEYGWTRGGYGQVAEKETSLADVLARLLRSLKRQGNRRSQGASRAARAAAP